jgi:hypothetical protein
LGSRPVIDKLGDADLTGRTLALCSTASDSARVLRWPNCWIPR